MVPAMNALIVAVVGTLQDAPTSKLPKNPRVALARASSKDSPHFSDQVKATSKTTEGPCVAGTEFSGGVCQDTESTNLLGGTTFGPVASCTSGEDKVTLYLHTGTTRTKGGGALLKPTSTADTEPGLALSQPWVVSGTSTGTFVADFTGKIGSGGGECGVGSATVRFSLSRQVSRRRMTPTVKLMTGSDCFVAEMVVTDERLTARPADRCCRPRSHW
jgi:hypothetical protein